jgi:hypothetical protein
LGFSDEEHIADPCLLLRLWSAIGIIIFRMPSSAFKPVFLIMMVAGFVNFFLLAHVFPAILQYQGSIGMSRYIQPAWHSERHAEYLCIEPVFRAGCVYKNGNA